MHGDVSDIHTCVRSASSPPPPPQTRGISHVRSTGAAGCLSRVAFIIKYGDGEQSDKVTALSESDEGFFFCKTFYYNNKVIKPFITARHKRKKPVRWFVGVPVPGALVS